MMFVICQLTLMAVVFNGLGVNAAMSVYFYYFDAITMSNLLAL